MASYVLDDKNAKILGVDITGFGVHALVDDPEVDIPINKVDLLRLALAAKVSGQAGANLIALNHQFRLKSNQNMLGIQQLDAVYAVKHMAMHLPDCGISAGIEVQTKQDIRKALSLLTTTKIADGSYVALHLGGMQGEVLHSILRTLSNIHIPGGYKFPHLIVSLQNINDIEMVAKHAEVVRLRTSKPEIAQTIAQRLTVAAHKFGRIAPKLIVDIRVSLGNDNSVLNAREDINTVLSGNRKHWQGAYHISGNLVEVLREIESWIDICDGVMLIPTALQSDLSMLIRQVLPALQLRDNDDFFDTYGLKMVSSIANVLC